MNVDVKTLLRCAALFSQVLGEMKRDDGWLFFSPESIQLIVGGSVIEWWLLYEDPTRLRTAMVDILFTPEQVAAFAGSKTMRTDITRAALSLVANSDSWGQSFAEDIEAAKRQTSEGVESKRMPTERLQKLFVALAANLYNYLAVMVYGKSLCQLVKETKGGNDEALVRAVQVDRTVLNLPYFQQRLARAQLAGDANFLDTLAYRIRNPLLRSKLKHPELRIAFAILQDEGLLDSNTQEKLLDFCKEAGLYKGDDMDAFRKTLTAYRREQGKRKVF